MPCPSAEAAAPGLRAVPDFIIHNSSFPPPPGGSPCHLPSPSRLSRLIVLDFPETGRDTAPGPRAFPEFIIHNSSFLPPPLRARRGPAEDPGVGGVAGPPDKGICRDYRKIRGKLSLADRVGSVNMHSRA